MKQLWKIVAVVGMAMLVAAPVRAKGPGDEGGGRPPQGRVPGGRWGGPGQGHNGPEGPGGHPLGGPGWSMVRMLEGETAAKLELTTEQINTLKRGIKKMERQAEVLQEKVQACAREQAEILTGEGEIDEVALMQAIEKTGRVRTQLAKLRIQPIILMRKTLTPEQQQMFGRMMRKQMEKRRGEWGARQRGEGDHNGPKRAAWRKRRQDQSNNRTDEDETVEVDDE